MRMILHEIKKIWNLKILAVIAVLCALYFLMNMEWHVRHAQVNADQEALLIQELTERFGTSVTPEEMEAFYVERLSELIAELETHIANEPALAEFGIHNYVDFVNFWRSDAGRDVWNVQISLQSAEHDFAWARLSSLVLLISQWDSASSQHMMDTYMERYGYNDWRRQVVTAVLASGDVPALITEIREPLLLLADEFIRGNPLFAENGVYNYVQFNERWNDRDGFISFSHYRATWQMWRTLLSHESGFTERKLITLAHIYDSYINAYTRTLFEWDMADLLEWTGQRQPRAFAQSRIDSIVETHEYRSLMDRNVGWVTTAYFGHISVLVALAILALLTPFVTVDRMRNIHSLQYSAKLGRKILYRQITAALLSSVLMTTLLLVVFGGIYFNATGVLMYWNHNLLSFTNLGTLLFRFTFGQYLLILTGISYAVGLGAAMLAFIISRFSRNLMSAVIKVVPVFVALNFMLNQIGSPPLSAGNRLYLRTGIVGIEPIIITALFVFSLAAASWVARREKRVDVL